MVDKCLAVTKAGKPCQGRPMPGKSHCLAHEPSMASKRAEASRKGGAERSNAKRAAKLWAASGEQMNDADITAILKSCMFSVKAGSMTPGEAGAIANLAKTAISINTSLQLEERLAAIEEALGTTPTPLRKVS